MLGFCFPHARLGSVEVGALSSHQVHNLETGLSYATIQEAVDAPETLDANRIFVDNGIYYENVIVNKAVLLIGEAVKTTIVDGMGLTSVIELRSNNVTITGFTLRNSGVGWAQSGIALGNVGNSSVSGNDITNNYYGMWLQSSLDNYIWGNNFVNSGYAIGLYPFSNRNSIIENNVTASGHAGILLASSVENDISGNNITANEYGVELVSSSNNTIRGNNITNNSHGVALFLSSNDNDVIGNNIQRNGWGVETTTSLGNRIYHNNFINNTPQVFFYQPNYVNVWDTGYPGGGNFWSDYNSTDFYSGSHQNETENDWIGDAPYFINSDNEDHYPLMGMFYDFAVILPPYPTGGIEHVNVVSNSTISDLYCLSWLGSPNQYLQKGQFFIQLSVTQENGTAGFCRLIIPKKILNASSYIVLVDWKPVKVVELPPSNSTEVYLCFTYTHSEHEVIVTIPEFTLLIAMMTFIGATSLLVMAIGRMRLNHLCKNKM